VTWRYQSVTWERIAADMANIAIIVIGVGGLSAVGTLVWPYHPVPRLEIAVVGPTHAGDALRVHVDYCKTAGYNPYEVRWALLDGVTIMLPPTLVTLPPGCDQLTILLPSSPHMVPGSYKLRVQGFYAVWPWRTVIEEATSKPFEVTP